ncbi:Phenylacetic acid catabolic protein [Alkalihalobacillus sp. 1P02AB]|uniref:Phenylacetic acid catabolic protein n=1 Tax=Alkalihalobacillus sp. 1P02AB TaxID=3132260 RepID=UPI0039A45260
MTINKNISLIELAETIADNKYILGDRLVEVGISGPNLEATLSAIAMAQQELGHARLIYRWAFELKGLNGNRVDIKDQTGKAYKSNVEITNWIDLIAGLYVTNIATDIVMKAVIAAEHPDVNPPFSKMLKEQNEHTIYSKSWCGQLVQEKGSIPRRFHEALTKQYEEALQWLQKIEQDPLLQSEKMIQHNGDLSTQLKNKVEVFLQKGVVSNVNG